MPRQAEPIIEHDAIWTRQLVVDLERKGVAAAPLLAKAGLHAQALQGEQARIPFIRSAQFFELAAEATGDDSLGFHFAQSRDSRDAGLIGYVGLASGTVGDAIKNICRYRHVANDAHEIDLDESTDPARLSWRFRRPESQVIRQFREFNVTNLIRALRHSSGRTLRPISLSLLHPRNINLEEFERYFGCPVRFAAPENVLEFSHIDLAIRLNTSDDRLLVVLRQYCEDVLQRRTEHPPSLIERVERQIVDRLAKGEAKLDVIASELGMGARTLSRRLAELDTSFNGLLDSLRQALATRYLRHSNLELTEIAFLIGYSEVSAFTHAFRRWTGQSPSAYRAQLQ